MAGVKVRGMETEWGTARYTRALSHACVGAYYHDP